MESYSREWRNYVLSTLWPQFIERQFPTDKIKEATEIIKYYGKYPTAKNIYKFLTDHSLLTTLDPTLIMFDTPPFKPMKPYFWQVKNIGSFDIEARLYSTPDNRTWGNALISPGKVFQSVLHQPTGQSYIIELYCLSEEGCQATVEFREFDL